MDRETRSLTRATYVWTLVAIVPWAFLFGALAWGLLTMRRTEIGAWSWALIAYPLCGLWLSVALPFLLRDAGKPGWSLVVSFVRLLFGLISAFFLLF